MGRRQQQRKISNSNVGCRSSHALTALDVVMGRLGPGADRVQVTGVIVGINLEMSTIRSAPDRILCGHAYCACGWSAAVEVLTRLEGAPLHYEVPLELPTEVGTPWSEHPVHDSFRSTTVHRFVSPEAAAIALDMVTEHMPALVVAHNGHFADYEWLTQALQPGSQI